MGFSEKRKYPRVSESVECQLTVGEATLVAETRNISCGGILCRLGRSVPLMTRLDISFNLPGVTSRLIRCVGIVVRQEQEPEGFSTAIYFPELKPEDRRLIAEFVLRSMLDHNRPRP